MAAFNHAVTAFEHPVAVFRCNISLHYMDQYFLYLS